jgi:DNA polymerase III epsilon subunit family exonuclease
MAYRLISDTTFIAFDVETTGLYPVAGKLVELSGVKFEIDRGVIGTFDELINPQTPIPPEVARIHGITDEVVADRPTIDLIMPKFLEFIGGPEVVLIAHNASFDVGFVGVDMARHAIPDPGNPILDTLVLSRHCLPFLGSYKLENLVRYFKIPSQNYHRALADSFSVKEVFLSLLQRYPKIKTIEQVQQKTYTFHFSDAATFQVQLPPGFEALAWAIENSVPITMVYKGGTKGSGPRIITPLAAIQRTGTIYVEAYCHLDKIEKSFRLDRIKEFRIKK